MHKQSFDLVQETIVDGKVGRGLTNGNGFTNGFGSAGAPVEKSYVNGEASGAAELQTYKTGLTNGNGLSMGNGVTNGNGITNGNGQNGKVSRIPLIRSRRMKHRILGLIVAVFLIIAPLSLYLVDFGDNARGIVIDGDFRDWNDVYRHTDSQSDLQSHPNVNIIETGMVVENEKNSVLLVVDGWIMQGDGESTADQYFVFIDSDANAGTGYDYNGIGAEYMVHAYGMDGRMHSNGIYYFDKDFKSTEGRANNDWNGWSPTHNGRIASDGNKLEASLYLYKGTFNPDLNMHAVFETVSYDGYSDRTETVSSKAGYLVVDQIPVGSEHAVDSTSDVSALRLVATAYEDAVTVTSLDFAHEGVVGVSTSPALPFSLAAGESKEITVSLDTSYMPDEAVVSVELDSVGAETAGGRTAPVSVSGSGYSGYVENVPADIEIDGAFGDWARIMGHSDDQDEATTGDNSNIDIREYRTSGSVDAFSFYLRVDGSMMEGTKLLTSPITIDTDGEEPTGGSPAFPDKSLPAGKAIRRQ
jgi:hypothetical protein